jgi:hypothetical protein
MNFITKSVRDIKVGDILKGHCIKLGLKHEYNYKMYKTNQFDKYDLSILKYRIFVPDFKKSKIMKELMDDKSKLSSGINLTAEYFTDLFREYDKNNLYYGKLFKVIHEEQTNDFNRKFIVRTAAELTDELKIKNNGTKFRFYDDSFYNIVYDILEDYMHYFKLPNECSFVYRTTWSKFDVLE